MDRPPSFLEREQQKQQAAREYVPGQRCMPLPPAVTHQLLPPAQAAAVRSGRAGNPKPGV